MYNITFAQLIVVWVFGVILSFISFLHGLTQGDILFALFIPVFTWAALFFYTFGWKAKRGKSSAHFLDRFIESKLPIGRRRNESDEEIEVPKERRDDEDKQDQST